MPTVDDYLALVPARHADKAKFMAMLGLVLQPLADVQNLLTAAPSAYDVDNARGAQLDVIGAWVGVPRTLALPISNVYFAFDTVGIGFDQGVWYQKGDPTQGVATLDDETYRLIIKLKIAANVWDGTLSGMHSVFSVIASSGVTVTVKDNFDMTLSIYVAGTLPSSLFLEVLKQTFTWLKPMGVSVLQVNRI